MSLSDGRVVDTSRHLVLFGTSGCHLCELAEQVLLPSVMEGWQVALSDIAEDDRLLELYGIRIPVLRHNLSQRELDWPFDSASLANFLASVGAKV